MGSFERPDNTLFAAEIAWWVWYDFVYVVPALDSNGNSYPSGTAYLDLMPRDWHNGHINVLMVDGHTVGAVNPENLYPGGKNEGIWYP